MSTESIILRFELPRKEEDRNVLNLLESQLVTIHDVTCDVIVLGQLRQPE